MLPTVVVIFLFILAGIRLLAAAARWRAPRGKPVESGGETLEVRIYRGKQKSVEMALLSIGMPGSLRFQLRRETWIDRFFKRLGVAREPQFRNPAFDRQWYANSEDVGLLSALQSSSVLRERFDELLRTGAIDEIACAQRRLWAYSSGYDSRHKLSDDELSAEIARELHAPFRALREELQKIPDRGVEAGLETHRLRRRFSFVILGVILAGGAGFVYQWFNADHQVARTMILRASALTTIVVGACLVAALFKWLRGRAITHEVLLDILVAAVPMTWLAATGGFLFLNRELDDGAPRRVIVPIASIYSTGQKDTDYYLEVPGWPDPRGSRIAELRRREFELVQQRGCAGVLWREGGLGDGWIEEYFLPSAADCNPGVEK